MRRTAAIVLGAALLSAAHGAPATADTPRCVSRHEYDRVEAGMTVTKVHNVFDTEGTATHLGAPNELRYYLTCTGRGRVQVVFSPKGRVLSKSGRFF